ncbi:hypothetical protein EV13_1723 [Prochlorococcus sp. MIT 0702]|nr:hypothetical protein [Prochlorococcus sp. MIT 0701]KGG27989.1 hypothetical protein EV13_1723 [Prochlorococcus sp. MIT 0702]
MAARFLLRFNLLHLGCRRIAWIYTRHSNTSPRSPAKQRTRN